ncbi:MAG: LytS/YhcK type 5TM receptor domain-containing protein [Pseudomonadota bacterium]
MWSVLPHLLQSVGFLVVAAFVLGVVFDKVSPGPLRQAVFGALCGVFAALTMAMNVAIEGFVVDARTPLLVAAGMFGGPIGALLALPIPLGLRLHLGGPAALAGAVAVVSALSIGVAARVFVFSRGWPLDRRAVVIASLAAPLCLLALLAPGTPIPQDVVTLIILPFMVWLPFSTAILGLSCMNELTRSDASRREREAQRFRRRTQHLPQGVFDSQLDQLQRLNARYGTRYAMMVVAIDNADGLMKRLTRKRWMQLRTDIARIVRDSVRDCDVCTARGPDRFAVLLPHTTTRATLPAAERIRSATVALGEHDWHEASGPTVSIGVADVEDAFSADAVEVAAEGALYLARDRTPTGALGLPSGLNDDPTLVRSFPGAIASSHGIGLSGQDGEDGDAAHDALPAVVTPLRPVRRAKQSARAA